MLVSIIIPVYNGEKYLRKAIESAINQTTNEEYEIIVVNDGSTDSSADIVREYMWDPMYEGKVTLFQHLENKGTAAALNTGIKEADGKWIRWLSADDEMLPDCLETLVGVCEDNNTIFYTDYHIIDENSKHVRDFVEPVRDTSHLWKWFYGNGSTSFIHRDVFEKCGLFDESLRHSEDYEFWLRATMLHGVNLTLIPTFTINYRNHPDQLTYKVGGSNDKLIKERIKGQITAR